MTTVKQILSASGAGFGPSGLHGLVIELTDYLCFAVTLGYLTHCRQFDGFNDGTEVIDGCDLRPSSPRIAQAVAAAIRHCGLVPIYAGEVPTPALALAGLARSVPSIMVTGSHIPFDRNGIQFYTPRGEISKQDEQPILDCQKSLLDSIDLAPLPDIDGSVVEAYEARYRAAFAGLLKGMRVGLYKHSAVGRGINTSILRSLGAEVVSLGRSEEFVPIDTEAVSKADREQAQAWAVEHGFDALMSTDGDGDRPLLADETGAYFTGHVLGVLAAHMLGANVVVTPVSSNTAVERCGWFDTVSRTRIGSPHVLAAMAEANGAAVIGYEANGGFLTQTPIHVTDGNHEKRLAPLPTRDAVLPVLAAIALAKRETVALSGLRALMPARFSRADRLTQCPTVRSQELVQGMIENDAERSTFMHPVGDSWNSTRQTVCG